MDVERRRMSRRRTGTGTQGSDRSESHSTAVSPIGKSRTGLTIPKGAFWGFDTAWPAGTLIRAKTTNCAARTRVPGGRAGARVSCF